MTSECRYWGKCDVKTRVFNFTGFILRGKIVYKNCIVIGARFLGSAQQSLLCVLSTRTIKQAQETGIVLLGLHVFSSKQMSIMQLNFVFVCQYLISVLD